MGEQAQERAEDGEESDERGNAPPPFSIKNFLRLWIGDGRKDAEPNDEGYGRHHFTFRWSLMS